ncbi:MAG: diguanylate cyclase [Candidatus Aminicenantes bacterium]|nr:diguanylate cyclase [Candidatus Aminicenantes bacterium]
MKEQKEEVAAFVEPKSAAINLIIQKNFWLTRIRWSYAVFMFLFFFAHYYFSYDSSINYFTLFLIPMLSILGNLIFIFALNRSSKIPDNEKEYDTYSNFASIQLDFDLIVLTLLIFYSGAFDSPVIVLFIFYIMVSTFLIYHDKAFRKTLTAIILLTGIFFLREGINVYSPKLAGMVGFTIILLFAFFISAYLSKNLRESEKSLHRFLEKTGELSVTDRLTGLYDQSHFFLLLNLQLEKARRYNYPFAIVMFDVDHFKNYNDSCGHLQGSAVLKRISELMKKEFRTSDILARYGGDEFAVILSHSDRVGAYLAADRLREIVEEEPFEDRDKQPLGKITLSLGVAGYPEHGSTVDEILNNADKALYMAKNAGRNRAMIYEAPKPKDAD